jgi:two-component system, OmpR family, sensor histidine kinase KdpD
VWHLRRLWPAVFRSAILQSIISCLIISGCAAICFLFRDWLAYPSVALLMMMLVALIAMVANTIAVFIAAVFSALVWNFFFIEPLNTFHIHSPDDYLLFLMYLVLVVLHAFFSVKIKSIQQENRQKEEQEKSIRLYSTILNALSHDLRTPLATMLTAIETLQSRLAADKETTEARLLAELEHSSIRLHRQLENLLKMSRIDSGMIRLDKDWVDVNDFISTLVHKHFRAEWTNRIEVLYAESMPLLKLDSGILEQVVLNLVLNALQHSPDSTPVFIELNWNGQELMIAVRDRGPGIPVDLAAKVFDKFYKIPDGKMNGIGLGLSIVKGLLDAHNGTIELVSFPDQGLNCIVRIPIQPSEINNWKDEPDYSPDHR